MNVTSRLAACFLIASLLPGTVAAQSTDLTAAASPERLSLDSAVRLALEHNRQLESARLQIGKAEEDLAAARTRRLPSFETSITASQLLTPVDFSFPRAAFGDFPGIGPVPSTDVNVTTPRRLTGYMSSQVAQPLTQLVRIGLGIKNAEAVRDIEKTHARASQLSVVNTVKRLYFAILQSESAIASGREAIDLYRELDRTLEVRVAQKVVLRSDAMDVQVRLAQEELAQMTRTNALASQKEQLNQLLGRDVRTAFDAEEVSAFSVLDVDLQAAQARALERPDVQEARLKARQAEIDRRAKLSERIPDVSLAVSYNSNFNMDVLPSHLASAGLQVKWEPFDWGRKGRELASKTYTANQARLAVRDAEDRAVLDVNARFRKLTEMRAQLNVAKTAQESAREKLRVRTNQYQVQAALLSDVLHLRADRADADDRYQQALSAFWTAKADFEQAVGEDLIP
jgi:outer membrane protein TolC